VIKVQLIKIGIIAVILAIIVAATQLAKTQDPPPRNHEEIHAPESPTKTQAPQTPRYKTPAPQIQAPQTPVTQISFSTKKSTSHENHENHDKNPTEKKLQIKPIKVKGKKKAN